MSFLFSPMRFIAVAALMLAANALAVAAQEVPFDMSPEADLVDKQPEVDLTAVVEAPKVTNRFLLPNGALMLTGEIDTKSFPLFLTTEQAADTATLELAYINAVVIAPETSHLSVQINGTALVNAPVASSDNTETLSIPVPPGTLRAGPNVVTIGVNQRHRTDCTVLSTYELWTELDPERTVLSFATPGLDRVAALADLWSVGVDAMGITTIRLVAPGIDDPAIAKTAAALTQALSLGIGSGGRTIVELADTVEPSVTPGHLTVVLGTADQLGALPGTLAAEAATRPVNAMLTDPGIGNTLVVAAPNTAGLAQAMETLALWANKTRAELPLRMPQLVGNETLTFADLGVATANFDGRRFRTGFDFALPADFYASMYGEARLVLEAAFTSEVLPGSQVDLYVNGQIASSTPILRHNDGTVRQLPIKVPMRNFRPGPNRLDIEIDLRTAADVACVAGSARGADRILVAGSTSFIMPEFARLEALPNLAAFSGTGLASGTTATDLVVQNHDDLADSLTLLARLAEASGRIVDIANVTATPNPAAAALVVGSVESMPPEVLGRLDLARAPTGGSTGPDATLENWNTNIAGASDPLRVVRDWLDETFNIAPGSLRIIPGPEPRFTPSFNAELVMAQSVQPEGGVWTALVSADGHAVATGLPNLIETSNWSRLDGRVSVLDTNTGGMNAIAPVNITLRASQPWTFTNARLVAANWLSSNILLYALMLGGITILLSLATAAVLRITGRRS